MIEKLEKVVAKSLFKAVLLLTGNKFPPIFFEIFIFYYTLRYNNTDLKFDVFSTHWKIHFLEAILSKGARIVISKNPQNDIFNQVWINNTKVIHPNESIICKLGSFLIFLHLPFFFLFCYRISKVTFVAFWSLIRIFSLNCSLSFGSVDKQVVWK